MKKFLLYLSLVLGLVGSGLAQNVNGHYVDIALGTNIQGTLVQIRNATVGVFTGVPPVLTPVSLCLNLTDTVCSQPNTVLADLNGNFSFYAKPGVYVIQITATNFATYTRTDVIVNALDVVGGGGTVTGTGTIGTIPVWTSSGGLGNSLLTSSATQIQLGGSGGFLTNSIGLSSQIHPNNASCGGANVVPGPVYGCIGWQELFQTNNGTSSGVNAAFSIFGQGAFTSGGTLGVGISVQEHVDFNTTETRAGYFEAYENVGGVTVPTRRGIFSFAGNATTNTTTLNEAGVFQTGVGGSSTNTNDYTVHILSPNGAIVAGGGTLTNHVGLQIEDQTQTASGGTNSNPFAIQTIGLAPVKFGGPVTVAPTGGVGSNVNLTQEGTPPVGLCTSGQDNIYASSTQHGILSCFNAGATLPLVQGPASATNGHVAAFSGTNGGSLVDSGGVAVPLGSPAQVPVMNAGGTAYAPQTKPLLDVRDYGVKGDGVTDDTTALQSAITAACNAFPAIGTTLILPQFFAIKITSGLTITKCQGLTIDGQQSQGQGTAIAAGGASAGNAIIMWYGAVGGTMLTLNQVRDSNFKNFTMFANASNYHNAGANICLLDDEIGAVATITTNNNFEDLYCYDGNVANPNFIGVDVCPTAPGNCEQQNFKRLVIQCGGGTPTANNAGIGFRIGVAGQPFDEHEEWINTTNCSRGIDVESGFNIEIEHGDTSNNFTDLYANGGQGISYKNFRSESPLVPTTQTIVIGSSLTDLTLDHLSFSGLTSGNTTINYSSGTSGGKLTLLNSVWDNVSVTPIGGLTLGSNSAWLTSRNNIYPVATTCSFYSNFANVVQSMDNCRAVDATALNFENFYNRPIYLNAVPFTQNTTTAPSPALVLQASANTVDDDGIYFRNLVLANGTKSYLTINHPVTAGSAPASGITLPTFFGGLSIAALSVTPIIDVIQVLGTSGSTSYSYKIVANDGAGGTTPASAVATTATGNATLSGNNCIQLTWLERTGAFTYSIYRTASGGTPSSTGKIGTVYPGLSINNVGTYHFSDCGAAGDSTVPPSTNTSGQLISNVSTGTAPFVVASTTPVANLTVQNCGATCAITQPTISTGVSQGSGFKHQRFASPLGGTCPTGTTVGNACTSANLNWTLAFADNNYTVSCTLDSPTNQPHIVAITKQAAGAGITITIATDLASAANSGAECIAMHD